MKARIMLLVLLFWVFSNLPPSMETGANVSSYDPLISQLEGFSLLARLLKSTGVAREIDARSSLTLLAPNDSVLAPFISTYGGGGGGIPAEQMSDILRYHVLLQYLDPAQVLSRASYGWMLVDTLYQTTGRAIGDLGMVNISILPSKTIQLANPDAYPNPTANSNSMVLSTLKLFPYTLSIVQIGSVLIPAGLSSSPPPLPINITDELVRAEKFSMFVLFLQATGVDKVLEDSERQDGITIFAPTDSAFLNDSVSEFQMLPAQQKILVLEFHALNSFYPLGTLKEFNNPITPTIATTDPRAGGGGLFRVDVTSVNGIVTISDGKVHAPVTATILEHQPVAIYAIDKLLMPRKFPETPPTGYVSSSQQPVPPSTFSIPGGGDATPFLDAPSPSLSLPDSSSSLSRGAASRKQLVEGILTCALFFCLGNA